MYETKFFMKVERKKVGNVSICIRYWKLRNVEKQQRERRFSKANRKYNKQLWIAIKSRILAFVWLEINDNISAGCALPKCQAYIATEHDEIYAKNRFYGPSTNWNGNSGRNAKRNWHSQQKESGFRRYNFAENKS